MKRSFKRISIIVVAVVTLMAMTVAIDATSSTGYYWLFKADCDVSQSTYSISESMQITATGDVNGTIPQSRIWVIYLLTPNELHNTENVYGTWSCHYNKTYNNQVVSSEGVFYIFDTQVCALYGR